MISSRGCKRSFNRRSGLTIVEIAISAAIIGGVGVMALQGIAAMKKSQLDVVDLARAQLLARELMDEVLQQDFGPSATDGDVGQNAISRISFNSIDDYHNWNSEGNLLPQLHDGTLIDLGDGWTRRVTVRDLKPTEIIAEAQFNSKVKRVAVFVSRYGKELVRLRCIRTSSWYLTRSLDQIDDEG